MSKQGETRVHHTGKVPGIGVQLTVLSLFLNRGTAAQFHENGSSLLAAALADLILKTRRQAMTATSSAAAMAKPTQGDNFGGRTDQLLDAPWASAVSAGSRAS